MSKSLRLAAVDLGAESGRVVIGLFDGGRLRLDATHRFTNQAVRLPDGLHWNVLGLFAETLTGLARASEPGRLDGIGIDGWGCDYALLDAEGRMLGLPFSYRDERTSSEAVARVERQVGREELYRRTGIQIMPINTVFQLATEVGGAATAMAERIALIPDLFVLWMTGQLVNEATVASTTGLLEATGDRWVSDLVGRLGLPTRPFTGSVVDPGTEVGCLLDVHAGLAGGAVGACVRTVASHDTASAFVAAPMTGEHAAVLSSGTWSLLGVEVTAPRLDDAAASYNLTNERGAAGTVRLLRNVMGLWLIQECRRAWRSRGVERDYDELQTLARSARSDVPVFDPDDERLLHATNDMPARIGALCEAHGQSFPQADGELLRSVLVSLACKYRIVLEQLQSVSGRRIDTVHVVGGGARNELLCQLTADIVRREVVAGPAEASAVGNLLLQTMAAGHLTDLEQARRVVGHSAALRRFEPGAEAPAQETYQRFLAVTGRVAGGAVPTEA